MKQTHKTWILALIIIAAACSRLLFTGMNFTPLGAVALFGGAYLGRSYLAVLIPLGALYVSDLLLNNTIYASYHDGFAWMGYPGTYVGFLAVIGIGTLLHQRVSTFSVLGGSILGALAFFLVTNFYCWIEMPIYAKTFGGLLMSYEAGIPFFKYTLASYVAFNTIIFGAYELWLKSRSPVYAQ